MCIIQSMNGLTHRKKIDGDCCYTTVVYCGASETCCSDEILVGLCLIDGERNG